MELAEVDREVLKRCSDTGAIDYDLWPGILQRLPAVLDRIVETQFPPVPPVEPTPTQTNGPASSSTLTGEGSATFASTYQSTHTHNITPGAVPADLIAALDTILTTLQTYFFTHPPHTIQRLSELILTPTKHYKYLPAYLHALDRVVHVTSGDDIYPLPDLKPDAAGARILTNGAVDPASISWGTSTQAPQREQQPQGAFGGDESLGGALLTPIPWLKKNPLLVDSENLDGARAQITSESLETIDGPNGPGGIETVSVSINGVSSAAPVEGASTAAQLRAEGGVTQGELLRQEQEAGVVPKKFDVSSHPLGDGEVGVLPHARGPEQIGADDIGPQEGIQSSQEMIDGGISGVMAAAAGRVPEELPVGMGKREAEDESAGEVKRVKEESAAAGVVKTDEGAYAEDNAKAEGDASAMDTTQ